MCSSRDCTLIMLSVKYCLPCFSRKKAGRPQPPQERPPSASLNEIGISCLTKQTRLKRLAQSVDSRSYASLNQLGEYACCKSFVSGTKGFPPRWRLMEGVGPRRGDRASNLRQSQRGQTRANPDERYWAELSCPAGDQDSRSVVSPFAQPCGWPGFFSRRVSRVARPLRVLRDRGYQEGVLPGLRQ